MTRRRTVPHDFPRASSPGTVPGAQPKLLVREENGKYYAGLDKETLHRRYGACEDLACQLTKYASRKMSESGLSLDEMLGRVEEAVKLKVSSYAWKLSQAEIAWVMKRTRDLLQGATRGGGAP